MRKGFFIAIDGPVAAGKGTIAPLLAQKLNGFYLYTGAMYRCFAFYCLREKIDLSNPGLLETAAKKIKIDLVGHKVILDGEDVTDRIKQEDIAGLSSSLATLPGIRSIMVEKQREIGRKYIKEGKIVVAEGRDVAIKIFPNAALKVFLTASPQVRAKRRLNQIRERGNKTISFEKVLQDVNKRDNQDSARKTDPLARQPGKMGYFVLDNSGLTEEKTLEALLKKTEETEKQI